MIITAGDVFYYTTNSRVNTDNIINDSWITLAQYRHIKPILTDDLFDAYIATKIARESTYDALDMFLKPCLAHYVLLDNIDRIYIQVTDNGLYKINQQNGTTQATEIELQSVKSTLKADARAWATLLTDYLNDNYESNVLYDKGDSLYNTIKVAGGLIWNSTTTATLTEDEIYD